MVDSTRGVELTRGYETLAVIWLTVGILWGSAARMVEAQTPATSRALGLGVSIDAGAADRWAIDIRARRGLRGSRLAIAVEARIGSYAPDGTLGSALADSLGFGSDARPGIATFGLGIEWSGRAERWSPYGRGLGLLTWFNGQMASTGPPSIVRVSNRLGPGVEGAVGLRLGKGRLRPWIEGRLDVEHYAGDHWIVTFPVLAVGADLRLNR